MLRFALVLAICLLAAVNAQAVLVIGYAYLSGQSNHENIRVIFEAVSPSAETDTAYTNSEGAFADTLEPGVYNILYSHAEYADYRLGNQVILWDTTLDPVTLLPPLSGYLSGVLGPGDFQVTDSIVVDSNTSLTIQPGTRLLFDGFHRFVVRGLLTAIGTEQDSIVFTRRYPVGPDTVWAGMVALNADDQTRLEYARIEYAFCSFGPPYFGDGAALYCSGTDIEIRFSVLAHVRGFHSAAYFQHCDPTLTFCRFEQDDYGNAAVNWYDASPTITSCLFRDNTGLALNGAGDRVARITSCTFIRSGIVLSGPANVEGCVFEAGSSSNEFGGVLTSYADSISISRCTFFGSGHYDLGLMYVSGEHQIGSCAFYATSGSAISFFQAGQSRFQYCDFFALGGSPFRFYDYDPSQGPPAIGLIALTNPNGDSCDTYYNIFLDPQFVDTANGDYHLQAGSPCIDAGDPELGPDPDGTVADIGAFYFDQLGVGDPERTAVRRYTLNQNYPNPFNSATQIVFDVPRAERAEIAVYDITGRLVRTLFSDVAAIGRNTVAFSGDDLPSGLYFCRLTAGDFRQTRKLVLIK